MNAVRWMIAGLSLACAGYTLNVSAADPAAVLQQTQGRVFVGKATTMTPGQPGMPLFVGNRVVAAAGGNAIVVYQDGCTVTVAENSLLAIRGPGQCKAGGATARLTGRFQNSQIGQAPPAGGRSGGNSGPDGGSGGNSGPDGGGAFGLSPGATAGLGFLVVGGIGAIAASNNNNSHPASPQ